MSASRAQIIDKRLKGGGIGDIHFEQERGLARGAVAFGDGGVVSRPIQKPVVIGSVHFGGNQRGDRTSQSVRRNDRSVSGYDPPIFQPSHTLDHGGTGKADPLGERFHGEPAIRLKFG